MTTYDAVFAFVANVAYDADDAFIELLAHDALL